MASIDLRERHQGLPRRHRRRSTTFDLEIADGELHGPRRPVGLGQDDRAADDRRARGADRAARSGSATRVVNDVHPMDRDIAMVFQSYALYPHMTVAENMGFGLQAAAHAEARDPASACSAAAEMLGARRPAEAQARRSSRAASASASRWAARSCASPAAFLMDEPLSNLDAKLRVEMRAYISRLHQRARHDDDLRHPRPDRGDDDGRPRRGDARRPPRCRCDTPQALYDRPADLFVAGFIGSPAMNLVRAHLEGSNGTLVASFGSNRLELPVRALPPALARDELRDVIIGLRPEHLELALNGRTERRCCAHRSRSPSPLVRR